MATCLPKMRVYLLRVFQSRTWFCHSLLRVRDHRLLYDGLLLGTLSGLGRRQSLCRKSAFLRKNRLRETSIVVTLLLFLLRPLWNPTLLFLGVLRVVRTGRPGVLDNPLDFSPNVPGDSRMIVAAGTSEALAVGSATHSNGVSLPCSRGGSQRSPGVCMLAAVLPSERRVLLRSAAPSHAGAGEAVARPLAFKPYGAPGSSRVLAAALPRVPGLSTKQSCVA